MNGGNVWAALMSRLADSNKIDQLTQTELQEQCVAAGLEYVARHAAPYDSFPSLSGGASTAAVGRLKALLFLPERGDDANEAGEERQESAAEFIEGLMATEGLGSVCACVCYLLLSHLHSFVFRGLAPGALASVRAVSGAVASGGCLAQNALIRHMFTCVFPDWPLIDDAHTHVLASDGGPAREERGSAYGAALMMKINQE